jgi:hypothetical protein
MAATSESVLKDAQQLDAHEQVLLAESLVEGLVETAEHRQAWAEEALRAAPVPKHLRYPDILDAV